MSSLTVYFSPEFIDAFGWTLLHSLWQGMVLVALLSLFLGLASGLSSRTRYLMSLFCLVFLTVWFGLTLASEYRQARLSAELAMNASVIAELPELVHEYSIPEPSGMGWEELQAFVSPVIGWLPLLWLAGTLVFSLKWIGGYFYLQRIRTQDVRILEYDWQSRLNRLAHQMGIRQTLLLKESTRISSPMVIGHIRPVILVPIGLLTGISPAQLEAILAHEIAHIRRYDFLINLIQSMLEIVFFYHPAYWWLTARIQDEREHCCDDIAVEVCGDPITYARALTEIEAKKQETFALAMHLKGRKNYLTYRIKRIVMPQSSVENSKNKAFFTALLILGLCSGIWLSPSQSMAEETFTKIPSEKLIFGTPSFFQTIVTVDTPPPPPPPLPKPPASALPEVPPVPPVPDAPAMPALPQAPSFPEMPELNDSELSEEFKAAFEMKMRAFEESQQKWEEELARSMEKYEQEMKGWEKQMESEYKKMEQQFRNMEQFQFEGREGVEENLREDRARIEEQRVLREEMMAKREEMHQLQRELREKLREEHLPALREAEVQQREALMQMKRELQQLEELRRSELMESQKQRELAQRELRLEMDRMREKSARMAREAREMADRERAKVEEFKIALIPQLREDGLIRRNNERITITAEDGEMRINGQKLSDEQEKKYRKILKDHGLKLGSKANISISVR